MQVDSSPYARTAHEMALAVADDPLVAEAAAPDLAGLLAPLPLEIIYELGIAPAVRLVAGGVGLDDEGLRAVGDACWRAVTRDPDESLKPSKLIGR